MSKSFKTGDRVKLLTGSVIMTVKGNAVNHSAKDLSTIISDKFECYWHDGSKKQQAIFAVESLVLISR